MALFCKSALFTCLPLLAGLLAAPVSAQGSTLPECSTGGNFNGGSAVYRLRDFHKAYIMLRLAAENFRHENLKDKAGMPAILEISLPMVTGNYMSNSLATLHAGHFVYPKDNSFVILWQTTLTIDGGEQRTYDTTNLEWTSPPDFELYPNETYVQLGSTEALVAAIRDGKKINVKVAIEDIPESFYSADLDLSRLTQVLATLKAADPKIRQMAVEGKCAPAQ